MRSRSVLFGSATNCPNPTMPSKNCSSVKQNYFFHIYLTDFPKWSSVLRHPKAQYFAFQSLFSLTLFLIHNFDFQCMIAINMTIISTIMQHHITKYTMLIFTLHWKCQIIANFWLFQMQLDARPASELIAKRFRNKTEDSEMNKKNCKIIKWFKNKSK